MLAGQIAPGPIASAVFVIAAQDLVAFVSHFLNHHPAGDLAPPQGIFDLNDLLAFIDTYYSGCGQ